VTKVRTRLFLALVVWMATAAAVTFWFISTETPLVRFAAGEKNSESYRLASAIAEKLNKSNPHFTIRVYDTVGPAENLELVQSERIDIAVVQADLARPDNVLDLARLYPDAYHLLANAEHEVENVADLRGLRVAIPPEDTGQNRGFWSLAAHYGLQPQDISALPMAAEAATFALAQGQVDAAFTIRSPGNPKLRELLAADKLVLVPIDQGQALALLHPALRAGVIPRGAYGGEPAIPPQDLSIPVLDRVLVAHSNLSEEVAYQFTRRLFDLQADIAGMSPLAGFISQLSTRSGVDSKTHPGARRYYDREKPGIVQQNARLASAILYTVVIIASALVALRGRWLKTRRLRIVHFNKRLMKIASVAQDCSERTLLLANKRTLINILEEVVDDLDSDKVSQEEFEHLSFTWQAVDSVVRDQLLLIHPVRAPRPDNENSE
jgi:TRAP transporter TAXI family solute receptor